MSHEVIELKRNPKLNGDLDALLWVAQAVSKDPDPYPGREVLQNIHIEKDEDCMFAVATDGKRLHCARLTKEIAPGEYRVWKMLKTVFLAVTTKCEKKYPGWRDVFPKFNTQDMTHVLIVGGLEKDGAQLFDLICKIHALNKSLFNVEYIGQATSGMRECFMYQKSNFEPLVIRDNATDWTRMAVMMPVRTVG